MDKHRPGPWILSESSVLRHGDTKETQICEIFCNRNNKLIAEIPDYCYHAEDAEQDKADGRLIAAAPDLLEAAEYCRDLLMSYEINRVDGEEIADAALAKLNAAIAKATGQ